MEKESHRHTCTRTCAHRIDFFCPQRRREVERGAIVAVLYAFTDNLKKAVCQNASSSVLNNVNIKGGATVFASSVGH